MKMFYHAHVDQSLLNVCTKFLEKQRGGEDHLKGRRRPLFCKWAFFQVPSLILWWRSTLPLIMQIIEDKNKIR